MRTGMDTAISSIGPARKEFDQDLPCQSSLDDPCRHEGRVISVTPACENTQRVFAGCSNSYGAVPSGPPGIPGTVCTILFLSLPNLPGIWHSSGRMLHSARIRSIIGGSIPSDYLSSRAECPFHSVLSSVEPDAGRCSVVRGILIYPDQMQ